MTTNLFENTSEDVRFKFDTMPIPPTNVGARSAAVYDVMTKLKTMQVGESFLETVDVDEGISDGLARAEDFAIRQNALHTRLLQISHRFRKQNPGDWKFKMRKVNDTLHGKGVRVWRVEPKS